MNKFSLSERYRLELHWDKAIYEQDGVCKLNGCYFSGPALSDALKLNENDSIMLDFFKQYLVLVNNVYVAKFSWEKVEYSSKIIKLSNTFITHNTELNKVPKLNNTDYLIIDCSDHEVEKHVHTPLYKTYVVNCDTNLYNFRNK